MNTTIEQLFTKYPDVDLILGGIRDQYQVRRDWVWNPIHGWNHFYPRAVFSRPSKGWQIETLADLYEIMARYHPQIINYHERVADVFDPFAAQPSHEEYMELRKDFPTPEQIQAYRPPQIMDLSPMRRLLLIGDYNHQCAKLAQEFESLGWEVKRCATDLYQAPIVDYNILDYEMRSYLKDQYRYAVEMYRMAEIINYADADHILVVQNALELDFKYYKDLRVHYYAHEGAWPRLPHNTDIRCFFHAYLGAPEQYKNAHQYRMRRVQHTQLVPYAWSPEQYPPAEDTPRDVFFGFMGSLGSNPDPHDVETMDYVTVKLRHLRNEVVPHAVQRCGLDLQPKGTDAEYIEYMHHVSLALNVSSEFGWTTERQYHAMGMGCVLVQNYYAALEQLGFKDRVNCLLYKNKYDLEEVIDWARTHPAELETIRTAGIALALQNTYRPRVQAMMEAMMKYE